MNRVVLRVQGLTEDDVRRQPRLNRRSNLPGRLTAGVVVAAIVYVSDSTPGAIIAGTEFRGRNVIVMVDRSPSMGGTEERLAAQLGGLRAAGISVGTPQTTQGSGLSPAGKENLLHPLKQALEQNRDADTVYVFSDFTEGYFEYDGSDEAGFQELRKMVTARRLRLYVGTVNHDPPPEFAAIARESGGNVIQSK